MTAQEMKIGMVRDYLLYGRGYAYINWSRNSVSGLHYIRASDVSYNSPVDPIFRSTTYCIGGKAGTSRINLRLLRHTRDGVSGVSVVDENKEMLSIAYTTMLYEKKLIASGGCRKAYIKSEKPLSQKAMDDLKESWRKLFKLDGDAAIAINAGVDVKEGGILPVDLQMNENKIVNASQVYELFGLAAEIIRGTATDEQIAHAVQNAIVPDYNGVRSYNSEPSASNRKKGKKYFAFDLKELLKGDIVKRYRAYQIALQSNFMQLDEGAIRRGFEAAWVRFNQV